MIPDTTRRQALVELSRISEGLAGERGHVLMLNDYQVANLRALFNAIGYAAHFADTPSSPLSVANNGDWIGEIYQMLPYEGSQKPNVDAEQLRKSAIAWKGQEVDQMQKYGTVKKQKEVECKCDGDCRCKKEKS